MVVAGVLAGSLAKRALPAIASDPAPNPDANLPPNLDPFQDAMPICTGILVPGVHIEVREAGTGRPLGIGTKVEISDGRYKEEATSANAYMDRNPFFQGAFERPGTYTVTVRRQGYRDWTAKNVVVKGGQCHVTTVGLRADLAP